MDEDDDVAGYFPAIVAKGLSEVNDSRCFIFFDVGYMNYLYFPDLREVVDSVVDVKDGPEDIEASLVFINHSEYYQEGWMYMGYMGSPLFRSIGEKS